MADEWHNDDDDSEEEEEDFMPDDDGLGDSDLDAGEEDDENPADIPPFLEGDLFRDPARGGALCYEQEGVFCLVCQSALPSNIFDFRSPPTGQPLKFAGWIQTPSNFMEFSVEFSRQPASDDPLEEKLLKAQDDKNATAGQQKQSSKASGNLKAPPSYSAKSDEGSQKSPPKSNLKAPPSYSVQEAKTDPVNSDDNGALVVISATRVQDGKEGADRNVTFRGAYRPPSDAAVERLCLISSVQVEEASSGAAAGDAVAPPAAAASRKRRRSAADDDDSVEGRGGVEYQELIDLHDDAGLSTEELRRRYYGGGGGGKGTPDEQAGGDSKIAATSKPFGDTNDNDSDDDDDDIGF